jgi:TolB-like protein/DNA-binding winged helix-turn-helix (wHTH) protein/tetratricopeptide (TPR) repeat protein
VGRSSAPQNDASNPASGSGQVFRFAVFELDARSGELRRHGQKVRLPHQAFRILELLLGRPGEVVTREELRQGLWPAGTFVDFEVGLNNAVRKLREALGDSAESPAFIETLPRHGYRFIGSVQPVTDPAPLRPMADVASGTRRLRRVAITAVLGIAVLGAVLSVNHARGWRLLVGAPDEEIRSLAVLPFENLTGEPGQEYLAAGITDALTTHLAQSEGLTVISHMTAKRHEPAARPAARPAPDIGRDLNVDALVQGAVVRSGQYLRISARVIHAANDRYVWARSYEGELGDIITLQRRIAGDVAAAIGRALPPVRAHRSKRIDPAAADAYMKGLFAAGKLTYESLRMAVGYFEDAIARQPDYAEAHAALGHMQLQMLFGSALSPRHIVPKAESAARKAIELDETLWLPHQTLGTILTHFHWKWEEGAREYRRARQLRVPNRETSGTAAPVLLREARFDHAIAEAARERNSDPQSFSAQIGLATAYRNAAQYDRAIAEFRRAFELQPDHPRIHFHMGVTFALMEHPDQAIPELERAVKPAGGNTRMLAYLGHVYAAAGRTDDARRVLSELVSRSKTEYVSFFGIALIHDVLGEKELALAALERAYEDRAVEFAQMSQYPPFKTIASEPRYDALMRRIGFPR